MDMVVRLTIRVPVGMAVNRTIGMHMLMIVTITHASLLSLLRGGFFCGRVASALIAHDAAPFRFSASLRRLFKLSGDCTDLFCELRGDPV